MSRLRMPRRTTKPLNLHSSKARLQLQHPREIGPTDFRERIAAYIDLFIWDTTVANLASHHIKSLPDL